MPSPLVEVGIGFGIENESSIGNYQVGKLTFPILTLDTPLRVPKSVSPPQRASLASVAKSTASLASPFMPMSSVFKNFVVGILVCKYFTIKGLCIPPPLINTSAGKSFLDIKKMQSVMVSAVS